MSSSKNVTYKCPFCDKRFNREKLVVHVEENHENELPEDFTALRYVFNYVNRKPESYHGKCTECGGPTPWDENKGRYNRQCGSKTCHDSFVRKCEDNMLRKTGHKRISETEEGQIKMLANRKISGIYKFKNGKEKTYTGSYELKALEFMDKVMNIDPDDILCPGPILEYTIDKVKHLYITDFYYIPYNLVIEVKDGGQNPNNRNMPEYRAKQIAKEKYIIKNTDYNYLRLTDNDFSQLLSVFMDLKMQLVDNSNDRVIHVNECGNFDIHYNPIEVMGTYNGDPFKENCAKMKDALINRRTIVFDVGQVLVDFNEDEAFNSMNIPEDAKAAVREALHMVWKSPEKTDFVTLEEEKEMVKEVLEEKYHKYIDIAYNTFPKFNKLYPHWQNFITMFKKRGFKIYILSNWSKWDWDQKANKDRLFKFLDYVDGAIVSWMVKVKKPDHRIYEALFNKYNLDPNDCIFFDDRDDNRATAEKLGMVSFFPSKEIRDYAEEVLHAIYDKEDASLLELMGMASYAPVRGLRDSEVYMVMRPNQNNVFAKPRIGLSDGNFDKVFALDDEDKLVELSKEEVDSIKLTTKNCFKVGSTKEVTELLRDKIGTVIEGGNSGLYKLLTGKDLLDERQIEFNLESIEFPNTNTLDYHIKTESYFNPNNSYFILADINAKMKEIKEVIDNG